MLQNSPRLWGSPPSRPANGTSGGNTDKHQGKKVASAYVFKGTNVLEAAEARNSPRLVVMKECQGPEVELPPPSPFALPTASGPFSGIFLYSLPTVHVPNLGEVWGVSFSDHLMSFSYLFSPPNFC